MGIQEGERIMKEESINENVLQEPLVYVNTMYKLNVINIISRWIN